MKINDNTWLPIRILLVVVSICFVLAVFLDVEEEEKKGGKERRTRERINF